MRLLLGALQTIPTFQSKMHGFGFFKSQETNLTNRFFLSRFFFRSVSLKYIVEKEHLGWH